MSVEPEQARTRNKEWRQSNYGQQVMRVQDLLPKRCLPLRKDALGLDLRGPVLAHVGEQHSQCKVEFKKKEGVQREVGACWASFP